MSSAVGDFSTSLSLIRRTQAVETGAWETVVRLYGPLIYGWGRRMGLQSQDAADLTQTVFLSVWRGLPGFTFDRPDASFRGWLRTIAQNAVRARGRRKPSEILIGERLEDVPDAALELTITGAASDPMFGTLANARWNWSARRSTRTLGMPSGRSRWKTGRSLKSPPR